MCIFSGDIDSVGSTRIFSRLGGGTQFLVYEMVFQAPSNAAMILPVPLEAARPRNSVAFVDLSGYPDFFSDLDECFPAIIPEDWSLSAVGPGLEVHRVGSFVASYVPSVADFSRLDTQFRLAPRIWEDLPVYADYGFVVFQFGPGLQKPHPMAFSFRSAVSKQIYFPTTHVHDSTVHSSAEFDHTLYLQTRGRLEGHWELGELAIAEEETASTPDLEFASPFEQSRRYGVKIDRARGLIRSDRPIYRRNVTGVRDNSDIWVLPDNETL